MQLCTHIAQPQPHQFQAIFSKRKMYRIFKVFAVAIMYLSIDFELCRLYNTQNVLRQSGAKEMARGWMGPEANNREPNTNSNNEKNESSKNIQSKNYSTHTTHTHSHTHEGASHEWTNERNEWTPDNWNIIRLHSVYARWVDPSVKRSIVYPHASYTHTCTPTKVLYISCGGGGWWWYCSSSLSVRRIFVVSLLSIRIETWYITRRSIRLVSTCTKSPEGQCTWNETKANWNWKANRSRVWKQRNAFNNIK